MTDQTPATEARICICWIEGFPRGTRHQSECDSYNDGRADALREAAERVRDRVTSTWAQRGGGYVSMDARADILDAIDDGLAILDPEAS